MDDDLLPYVLQESMSIDDLMDGWLDDLLNTCTVQLKVPCDRGILQGLQRKLKNAKSVPKYPITPGGSCGHPGTDAATFNIKWVTEAEAEVYV